MKDLKQIAFIFSLIGTILLGFAIIPLIWCIPMTVSCYRIWKENRPATIDFGIFELLFCSLVAGILLLVDSTKMTPEDEKNLQTDMLRYRDNKLATTLGYIGMLSFILAFCFIYSTIKISDSDNINLLGITQSGFLCGLDIFINIIMLLFLFLAINEMKVYSKKWAFVTVGLGAFQILRAFLYPLSLLNAGILDAGLFTGVLILYIVCGALLILAGIVTVLLHNTLENYLKTVKAIENERLAK